MASIQEAISQGKVIALGPVEILQVYDMGKGYRSMLVGDASGKTIVKLWGQAANSAVVAGQSVTIVGHGAKGNVNASEYPQGSGKISLNANDCSVTIHSEGGGSQQAARPSAAVPSSGGPASKGCLSLDQLVEMQADYTFKFYNAMKALGAPEALCQDAAARSATAAAEWWFGCKWPGQEAG